MTTQHGLKLLKGSPPHTWRKLVPGGAQTHNNRITSTYVEKIMLKSGDITQSQDHLHIRGENCYHFCYFTGLTGITSTYVEKINQSKLNNLVVQDHLHIRGENLALIALNLTTIGSPPHTWRKSTTAGWEESSNRITSTYVEKIPAVENLSHSKKDHLHIRGENSMICHSQSLPK